MMKKILTMLLATAILASCSNDDDLWDKVNNLDNRLTELENTVKLLNADIGSINTLVSAFESGQIVASIAQVNGGYEVTFDNGKSITVKLNGKDGRPIIGVAVYEDGLYYWTATSGGKTEWYLNENGDMVRVVGSTPEIGVSDDGYWTINGKKIQDANGNYVKALAGSDSFFKAITQNDDTVTFTLSDDTTIVIAKVVEFGFSIQYATPDASVTIKYGATIELEMQQTGVVDYMVAKPDGWKVLFGSNKLSITAPLRDNPYADFEGTISVLAVSRTGASKMSKIKVAAADESSLLYTVTFEGSYWEPFVAKNYAPGVTATWGSNFTSSYAWKDKETQLTTGYGMYPWIVSSYNSSSLNTKTYAWFTHDLYVYNPNNEDSHTGGGNKGSDNFLIGYGYLDLEHDYGDWRPIFKFADGVGRTVKSLYVNSTNYFLGVVAEGNSLSPALGKDEEVNIIFTGYDELGNKKELSFVYASYEKVITGWTKWDLSGLGKVVEIYVNMVGGTDNGYGFSLPAYYAVDDITVMMNL